MKMIENFSVMSELEGLSQLVKCLPRMQETLGWIQGAGGRGRQEEQKLKVTFC